jgi:o-succinylbenzoate synthase
VRIVAARLTPVRLPLKRPLVTGHGEIAAREGIVLELEDDTGARGLGEALPLPGFGLETCEQAETALQEMARTAITAPETSLPERLDRAAREHAGAPCARAAFDVALHDLAARRDALPLASWLAKHAGTTARPEVTVSRLLTATAADATAAEARLAVAEGFGTLKLKVGAGAFEADLERVAAVRERVGPDTALRLDANGAWSEREALEHIARLAPHGIELLEQPIAAGDPAALARVREAAPFPIAADEAVGDEAAADALLAAGAADLLVLKPAALGGLQPCGRIAARARRSGVGVVVTSFLDSALGVCAALHLAASLPLERAAAGLATSDRLLHDLAEPPACRSGFLRVPAEPGLGCALDPGRLARVATGPTRELRA